jgi:phosphoglycerate kinase
LEKADAILIGGAMAYTFRLAQGHSVGKSLVEPDKVDIANKAVQKAKAKGIKFLLPVDDVVAIPVKTDKLDKKGKPIIEYKDAKVNSSLDCPTEYAGLDIGPETIKQYSAVINGAKTILWNGPMGLFENKLFAAGTNAIAKVVAEATQTKGAKSIIGGGDSVKALNKAGLADKVTFVSTGGGASLEFLEGKVLPGVAALTDK